MCPGNRVIFTCQQTKLNIVSRWTINLPSGMLQTSVRTSQVESKVTIVNDPGFHFEIHIVSNSSNGMISELQVTAVRQLNGVTVECDGPGVDEHYMSTIEVASVGELIIVNKYMPSLIPDIKI